MDIELLEFYYNTGNIMHLGTSKGMFGWS